MYLDINNPVKPIQATVRHEVIHVFRQMTPKGFKVFSEFVVKKYKARHGVEAYDTYIKNKKAEYADMGMELTDDGAMEEFCADIGMDIMQNKADVTAFVARHMQFAQKLADAFNKIQNVVRKAFKLSENVTLTDTMKQLADFESTVSTIDGEVERRHAPYNYDNLSATLSVAELRQAQELLLEGIAEYEKAQRYVWNRHSKELNALTPAKRKQRFAELVDKRLGVERSSVEKQHNILFSSLNEKSLDVIVKEILNMTDDEAVRQKTEGNYILISRETPEILLEKVDNAKDLKIIMRFDALYLAVRQGGVLDGHYHNYGIDFATKIKDILNNPDAIVRLKNGRINIIGSVVHKKGKHSIISIELETIKDINSKNDYFNLVVTMMPVRDNLNYIGNLEALKVEYEKEDLAQVNPQLHESLSTFNVKPSFAMILSQEAVDVKNNFSTQADQTDNNGNFDGGNADIRFSTNGYIPKGENPARDIDVPIKVNAENIEELNSVKNNSGIRTVNITHNDIKDIQSIGRKSVNEFTSEDIRKSEKFARRYFKEMGTKMLFVVAKKNICICSQQNIRALKSGRHTSSISARNNKMSSDIHCSFWLLIHIENFEIV